MDYFPERPLQSKRLLNKKNAFEKILLKKKKLQLNNRMDKYKEGKMKIYLERKITKETLQKSKEKLAKKEGKLFVSSNSKVYFVIRIRGINGIPPKVRKILELLRLDRINAGIFLKNNPSTTKMLKSIEPFIAYGYPSFSSIKNLIEKRGAIKLGKRGNWHRESLKNDKIIASNLNFCGIYSKTELCEMIYSCGNNFKMINNALWPFRLRPPKKGFSKVSKKKHVVEGGVFGNWGSYINTLIEKMV
mmetsp:Transcript_42501/g.66564  ORF Transcript_42501/g.66564 Transcript_42501/m.66564 type:complete len:246 (-) Transcript_42501:243-980(-)